MLSEGLNGTEIERETEVKWPVQKQSFFVLNVVEIHLPQLSSPFFDGVTKFHTFFAAKVDNMFGLSSQVKRGKIRRAD